MGHSKETGRRVKKAKWKKQEGSRVVEKQTNHTVKNGQEKSKKSSQGNVDDRYVVVITNVENDFAKVHREAFPRFCCLDKKFERGCSSPSCEMERRTGTTSDASQGRAQCHYTVSARTETRSVEIAIYGKADGNVSTVFTPVPGKHAATLNGGKKSDDSAPVAKAKGKERHKREVEDDTIVECVYGLTGSGTRFDTLEDMVTSLSRKPYFTHPPKFLLNIAGNEDGAILKSPKGMKRSRESGEGEHSQSTPSVGGELRQSTVRQSEMVTASAATSSRIGAKELRQQLKDIPGFVTCWALYQQHFRLVFVSKAALFKAKHLLDQFEVDGSVRVSITLPDSAAKEFVNQLSAEENTI
ncbi:uncharacterized protein TEOVI_000781300 [Trypanosoma equiperdum]|uniref:Uncharacterized protein n=2 Tax=Trypanozoon TaxID=39700 RepID=Q386D1_TRYB2|nr:hypothetical protein, conserved [Trypanosoma brucei brucei TREU927]EAN79350.1 hypothetical protein, conserved [Trypanosoma brucei brucei TREU927]SCU66635.1 hypothetical protein, conserved [Trypanosoma equiperdum]